MKPTDRARCDATLYGIGFIVNGERVDPRHVNIVYADGPVQMRKALAEYYAAAEHARHWPAGPNHIEAEQRLRAARTAVQDLLEKS